MLFKLLFLLYLMQYFVNGISTNSRFHRQLYTNQDPESQDRRSSEILDEQNDQSNESQDNLANQNLPNDISRKANNYPGKSSGEGIPGGHMEPSMGQSKPGGQGTPGSNEPTMGLGNLEGQKPSRSKESGMGQGKPGGHRIPASNESTMGQGKPEGQKAPGSMEQGRPGGQKTPGSIEPMGQGKPKEQKEPGSNKLGMGQGKPGGQTAPGSIEPGIGQGKPGGPKTPESKEPSVSQGKPGGQKSPGSMEPSMGQGKPGGQKLPGSMEPSMGQGKPGGQITPGSYVPSVGQGKPGGQKSPESMEPSKTQGKLEGPKTSESKESSMGQGKQGQQKPPGSTLPSTEEGKPGEQKTPGSKEPSIGQGKPGEKKSPGSKESSIGQGKPSEQKEQPGSKEPSSSQDISSNDECPGNKSLHSRNDIKVMINYLYTNLSIDEKIRKAYQSHAFSLRDKYLEDLKKFNSWFHNQPEHLKHVLKSLSNVRLQLVEPRVKKIAKLLKDNSEMDQFIQEKKNRLRLVTKKLRRYERLCSYNCEEQEDREERSLFKRQIQDEYFCSSIEDLYKKINEKLSQFVERFNDQSNDRFAKDNETYHIRIDNIKNKLRDKGLEMFGRTMYDILHLQDEYHHYVEHLNVTSLEMEINLAKNLNIQVDSKLLELNEHVERYGQYCKNCGGGDLKRSVRQTNSNPGKTNSIQIMRKKSETLVDTLLDEKFNESAIRVHNDWDKIFEGLNELINTTESETPQLGKFKPVQEEIMKMTKEEREALKSLKSTASDMVTQKATDWVKLLIKLLKIITDIINHIISLNSKHK